MSTRKPRSSDDYGRLSSAVEDGDYDVVGPVEVRRGRPRKGEDGSLMGDHLKTQHGDDPR